MVKDSGTGKSGSKTKPDVKTKFDFYPPPDPPVKETKRLPDEIRKRVTEMLRRHPHR
jgi:hypothetical protein